MNPEEKKVDPTLPENVPTTDPKPEEKPANSQNPLEIELNKIKDQGEGRTKKEKLLYTKKRIEEQLKELGAEDEVPQLEVEDENKPLTFKDLKRFEAERAQKTAVQLAEDIEDVHERELVKHHIQNTIRPSGNATDDLKLARAIVNSVKNGQIMQEVARKSNPVNIPSNSGAPAKQEPNFEPTAEELVYMRPPFNLTKEDIIKARKG